MEKYPNKRGYAVGKLQKFLAKYNLTKVFRDECKRQNNMKGSREIIEGFNLYKSDRGPVFWWEIHDRFERHLRGELDE